MKYTTGFLKVVCAWLVMLLPSLDARHAPKKHTAAALCRPKELTALTKSLVEISLTSFDEANGKHLGTWSPGFPELHVHQNSPLISSKVQCSLLFMAQGLGEVLQDQRGNLNPKDVPLHKELEATISQIYMLAKCVKNILGGECPSKPIPPKMPISVFERKQWSHTLLKTARDYLNWLEHNVQVHISMVKARNNRKHKVPVVMRQKYYEGSGYLL
ncbi:uncharacterized protein LOC111663070 [Seriola lalandi dorsalis]|uniref:uncharacterized protein LOC111663070 n=1 Tax=Seriola lalandi dorsalis TaxID=1841481 RepID=UPI000C6F4A4B|nr:uncharacterized protein LOC111663070 [Seriola lalandi dorsalis]XP_056233264.1 uncharacterized protein LOC130170131 [Seriola aureovittata]